MSSKTIKSKQQAALSNDVCYDRVASLEAENTRLRSQMLIVQENANLLFQQLQQFNGIKPQIRTLIYTLNRAVTLRAESINRPSSITAKDVVAYDAKNDKTSTLLGYSLSYDTDNLTESRLIGGLGRRIFSSALLVLAKAFFKSIELSMMLIFRLIKMMRLA